MAQLAFAQGRDGATERYMVLLGKTYRHFVKPDEPDAEAAPDVETIRRLVKRLVAAGELDLSDLDSPRRWQADRLAPPSSTRWSWHRESWMQSSASSTSSRPSGGPTMLNRAGFAGLH